MKKPSPGGMPLSEYITGPFSIRERKEMELGGGLKSQKQTVGMKREGRRGFGGGNGDGSAIGQREEPTRSLAEEGDRVS